MSATTKKCGRRGCEARIATKGRHCSRGRSAFLRHRELCKECREIYCSGCVGRGCGHCRGTGRLTERQLRQRAAARKADLHYRDCETCSRVPDLVAYEEYDCYLGKAKIGSGEREVRERRERCPEGLAIEEELRALGAVLDEDGYQSGWDGCDWGGEPLEECHPRYREAVTWRREADDEERRLDRKERDKRG